MSERRSWKFSDGVLLAGLTALAVAATWSIWSDIFGWAIQDEEQSHVLLAPAIAAWLVWVRRERLRYCKPRWTIWGPLLVAAGWLLAWQGFFGERMLFWHFGALLIVAGAALTVVGMNFVRNFMPAAFALLFLMPIPGMIRMRIALPLQEVTAKITHFCMELFGAPVAQHGNLLSINGVDVAVAEACNGMRMVAALALVSYAFVFSTPMRMSVRIFILAISPLVAIVCNVIRLVPTVLMYGYSDVETAEAFHDISGWAMLPIALAIVWGVFALLRWIEVPITPYQASEE
ncbi:MAG: exosortase/archaeosortase family protein [Phycisphaeraceae bacterium]|nr:MAG: exosortase/archaeosortase family protein [Phycisphaeraceae bacterium]